MMLKILYIIFDFIGENDYLVMNPVKGGSNINLNTNTNSYIRAGPGEIIGSSGADGYGSTCDGRLGSDNPSQG